MKSKFLYQNIAVVCHAGKDIVVTCFVCRNFHTVFMKTGKLCENIRVTKNGHGSGVEMFKSSESVF